MVKIPNFDELKKMGSGLMDQAKSVKFGEMVDRVKSGIDSVSGKKTPVDIQDVDLKGIFHEIFSSMTELAEASRTQIEVIKKVERQLEQLAAVVENYQKPTVSSPPPIVDPTVSSSETLNKEKNANE